MTVVPEVPLPVAMAVVPNVVPSVDVYTAYAPG